MESNVVLTQYVNQAGVRSGRARLRSKNHTAMAVKGGVRRQRTTTNGMPRRYHDAGDNKNEEERMAETYSVFIFPKREQAFRLIVGASGCPDGGDAWCVFAVSLDDGVAQHMCEITKPNLSMNGAAIDMAVIAERYRRAGATFGMGYARSHSWRNESIDEIEQRVLNALSADWIEDQQKFSRPSDIVASAFMEIANAIRLGPPP